MLNKLVCIVVLGWLIYYVGIHLSTYTKPFDYKRLSQVYSQSQYVLGPASKGGIGDDGVYAFAGYYYFFNGGDVSSVNFEHPPLGKYLIGLSIFLTGNENAINLLYFAVLLLLTYKIGVSIVNNKFLALLAVLFVSIDPLLLDHLLRSQLDLPFSLFFLAAVFFFMRSWEKPNWMYLSSFFWGCAFTTRFFPFYVVIWSALFVYLWLTRKHLLKIYILSSVLVPSVYLIGHIAFFVYHPSFVEFLRHKKWMLAWYKGTPVIYGNIWRNLLTGYYLDSTFAMAVNAYWTFLIPVFCILGVTRFRPAFIKRLREPVVFIYALTVFFLLYVTFLTNGLQKFVMPVYPLVILLAVSNLDALYSIIVQPHARERTPGNKGKTR